VRQSNSNFGNNVLSVKEPFGHNIIRNVGTGINIRFWLDKWMGESNIQAELAWNIYSLVSEQGFYRDGVWS